MKLLDKKTAGDFTKLMVFMLGDDPGDRPADRHDRQHLVRRQQGVQGAEFVDATGVVEG